MSSRKLVSLEAINLALEPAKALKLREGQLKHGKLHVDTSMCRATALNLYRKPPRPFMTSGLVNVCPPKDLPYISSQLPCLYPIPCPMTRTEVVKRAVLMGIKMLIVGGLFKLSYEAGFWTGVEETALFTIKTKEKVTGMIAEPAGAGTPEYLSSDVFSLERAKFGIVNGWNRSVVTVFYFFVGLPLDLLHRICQSVSLNGQAPSTKQD